nr:exosortase [Desulfobulbaceae bacterium]
MMILSRLIQWIVIVGLAVFFYWDVLTAWGQNLWDDPNYSHGLLIPFIAMYIVREKQAQLQRAKQQTYWPGLVVVCLAVLLYAAGYVGAEFFTKRLSFLVLLYGMILFLEGKEVAKILRFPVAVLFFAVPLPYVLYNSVAFPLKLIASKIAAFLIALTGMPVFLEGNVIALSHTTMEVVDACSGIRSLMTLFTLAFLLGYFQHKQTWKRVIVLLLATPVAVFSNAVRVTATGILTKYDPAWAEGSLHDTTGWLVFVLAFAMLLAGSALLKGGRSEKL